MAKEDSPEDELLKMLGTKLSQDNVLRGVEEFKHFPDAPGNLKAFLKDLYYKTPPAEITKTNETVKLLGHGFWYKVISAEFFGNTVVGIAVFYYGNLLYNDFLTIDAKNGNE